MIHHNGFIIIFVAMRYVVAIFIMLCVAFLPLHFVKFDTLPEMPQIDSTLLTKRVRIVAGGDFMQHAPQLRAARNAAGRYDYAHSMRYVAPIFRQADIAIINLETTLSKTGPYSGYPCFCSPAEVADVLNSMGVDVVAMANNHCCDRWARGILSTTDIIDSIGMKRVGVFRDSVDFKTNRIFYIKQNEISFAIVNYTYGTNGIPVPKGCKVALLDTVLMAEDFNIIKHKSVDCVIAVVHWGAEYQRKPNASQRRIETFMKRHGVDIIIGSHPHVVQPYKCDSLQGITLYSLGNFVSNQRKRYCDGGIVAVIDIESHNGGDLHYSLDVKPVWVQKPHYTLLTRDVGDTLKMNIADRNAYEQFMSDCELLQ